MPKRYRSRSRPKRHSMGKKRSVSRRRKSVYKRSARANDPFPTMKTVTMRYCETVNIDAGTGLPSTHIFRANGIFDPNYSGIGHQPFGHDQWMAIYNHYEVVSSKITATFIADSNVTTNLATTIVGIALRDDATSSVDMDNIREGKTATIKTLNMYSKGTITKHYNRRVMFPLSTPQTTSATFGADPAEQAFFHLFVTPISTALNPNSTNVVVTVEYRVKMWELKDFGAS